MANICEIHLAVTDKGQFQWGVTRLDKGLCYQMLELARDEIQKAFDAQQASPIHRASPGDLAHLPPLPGVPSGNGMS